MIEALVGAYLLASGVALGWWLHELTTRAATQPTHDVTRELSAALASVCRDAVAKSFILKGMPPHVAAPETFAPEGVTYSERDAVETEAVDKAEESPETTDEMQAALDEILKSGRVGS